MARREIGLMGYVGEAVVRQWLAVQYPHDGYEIIGQAMPVGVPTRGGPYLDFAVCRAGTVELLVEVKSQDYIWDMKVNVGLAFIWNNRGSAMQFRTQEGRNLDGTVETRAKLILLAPPNKKGIEQIGTANLKDVLLFEEILADLGPRLDDQPIIDAVSEDVSTVISILHNPTAGRTLKAPFLERRDRAE